MLKILFFIEYLTYNGAMAGAEKALITLVNHMDPEQFDITVQTLFPDENSHLLKGNIRYRYCYPKKNAAWVLLCRMESELGLTYRRHIKGGYDIEVAYLEYGTTKVIAASTNKKARKVAWVHCDLNVAVSDKQAFVRKTDKYYNKYNRIVCVSEQCKTSFDEIFGSRYETVVVHNVIDEKSIRSKAAEELPRGVSKTRYTICTVGNFRRQKNHLRLLKSCRRLYEVGYAFDLWIVGDGKLRREIEQYILDNHMQSYVKLWGFQDNPYPFMKYADLLVCSSDYEGYSTFIVEGVILGRRILTTDCSGMQEILKGYPFGTIVKNDDVSFYEGMRQELSAPQTKKMSGQAVTVAQSATLDNERFFKSLVDKD